MFNLYLYCGSFVLDLWLYLNFKLFLSLAVTVRLGKTSSIFLLYIVLLQDLVANGPSEI